MNEELYFFDSYAVIEIFLGNDNYQKYSKITAVLTKLNLFEIYYALLRLTNEEEAELFMKQYSDAVIDFDEEIIKTAAKFRIKYRKRNLSMVDCVGYAVAGYLGIRFLTGDKEFEDFGNVEFVK